MAGGLMGRRIMVLSDDDKFSRAIEWNLGNPVAMEVASIVVDSAPSLERDLADSHFDLLVVAACSPTSEPLVMVARASLAATIGRVPILIISDRPFAFDRQTKIGHLGFPFCPDDLHQCVKGMLYEQ